jgi:glycosyltransferase involved in cell wall biosynthesis
MTQRPSVVLLLTAAAHQQFLPEALAHAGLARAIVCFVPDLEILEPILKPGADGSLTVTHKLPSYRRGQRILWAAWRRVPPGWREFVPFNVWARFADHWISRRLPSSDVFQTPMAIGAASLRRAKQEGAAILIDNPTMHPAAFQREVLADCADAGFRLDDSLRGMRAAETRRCERQYEICDRIIVYSEAAARSFQPYPYANKVVVVQEGVDHLFYSPAQTPVDASTFRVCYVGRVEALKGVHRLIEAWKQLALPDAELVLIGEVMPELNRSLTDAPGRHIRATGILPPEQVATCYRESSLFVFPSVNEGLSRALLEAMSCGLPVIACRDTGAEDCVTPGKEGLLVPGRNTNALAGAILWCYNHRREIAEMGRAARLRTETEFTLSHYAQRLIALYRSVAGS